MTRLVIEDYLTNAHYGAEFPSDYLGDLSVFQAYTIANGLWISPLCQEQTQAAAFLKDIALACNSEYVWSSGVLHIVQFGDQTITANGYTYTAPSAPEYSLNDNDFAQGGPEGPVSLHRKRPADVYNSIKLECVDRENSYNPAIVEAKDQAAIDQFGLRQDSKTLHLFASTTAAKLSAQLMLQRQAIKNIYTFKVDGRYILLDPMDIIAITDEALGLDEQWVRVIDISENSDLSLTITAEEYLNGTGSAPNYSFQPSEGYNVDYNEDPGDVNDPIIFEAPVQIAASGLETWFVISGGANWGGCDVYISSDDNTYKLAGRITGSCRQGVLSADFNTSSDPDTSENCEADLTMSRGELLSGTQEDADLAHTLCYVDGELISYQTATLTAQYEYTLGTYIRRGQYGTANANHLSGSNFARLDAGVFVYPYVKDQIGKTFFAKFLSFNIYGGGQQSLADVPSFSHVVVGPPIPPDVASFSAQQTGGAVVFSWTEVSDFALKGYDILYGPQDGTIDNATFLTESARGTEMTNASVPPGTWRFYIRARDIADQFSANPATYDLIVTNSDPIILSAPQAPDFIGALDGFVRHFSGVLIPTSTTNADDYVQISAPSAPSLSQVTGGTISATTYYAKITYVNSYGSETNASSEASLSVSVNNLLVITSPATLSGAVGYNVYVSTSTGTETKQNTNPISIGTDWTLPTNGLIVGVAAPTYNNTGWEVFDWFVPDVVATSTYTTDTFDTGFNDNVRVWSSNMYALGYQQAGIPDVTTQLDSWLTGEVDPDIYSDWVIGLVDLRYFKMRLTMNNLQGSVAFIEEFTVTSDRTPRVEEGDSVVVAPGGTVIPFTQQFHEPPLVQVTAIAGVARTPTATNITETGFTAYVFDSSGADVGGTINWEATGE